MQDDLISVLSTLKPPPHHVRLQTSPAVLEDYLQVQCYHIFCVMPHGCANKHVIIMAMLGEQICYKSHVDSVSQNIWRNWSSKGRNYPVAVFVSRWHLQFRSTHAIHLFAIHWWRALIKHHIWKAELHQAIQPCIVCHDCASHLRTGQACCKSCEPTSFDCDDFELSSYRKAWRQ